MSATRSAWDASTCLIASQTLFLASALGASPRTTSLPPSTCTLLTWTFCAYMASRAGWYFFFRAASCCATAWPAAPSFLSALASSAFLDTPSLIHPLARTPACGIFGRRTLAIQLGVTRALSDPAHAAALRGKRLGLVCHEASVDERCRSSVDLFLSRQADLGY